MTNCLVGQILILPPDAASWSSWPFLDTTVPAAVIGRCTDTPSWPHCNGCCDWLIHWHTIIASLYQSLWLADTSTHCHNLTVPAAVIGRCTGTSSKHHQISHCDWLMHRHPAMASSYQPLWSAGIRHNLDATPASCHLLVCAACATRRQLRSSWRPRCNHCSPSHR